DLTTEQTKQVQFIRKGAEDLVELVNDLLDLAKVEAGKVVIRPLEFEAAGLFGALRGMLRPLLAANNAVTLVFEDPVGLPSLLIVEDNRETLFIYEKYLKGTGFQVIPARTARMARLLLKEVRPVAVVLDVLLEGESSWDLITELKGSPATRDLPVWVVTVV